MVVDVNTLEVNITPTQLRRMIGEFYCDTHGYDFLDEETYLDEAAGGKININKSKINGAAKDIVTIIKKDGVSSTSRKKIHDRVSELFEEIAHDLSVESIYKDGKVQELETNKVKRAVVLLVWVLIISGLATAVLTLFFGPVVGGTVMGAVIVAPVVEEASKAISIKGNFAKEYFIVFNAFEFTGYVMGGAPVLGRAAAVGLHGVTTIVQKAFDSEKLRQKMKVKDDEDAKNKSTFVGYILGCLIHGTWNAAAVGVALAAGG